MNRFQSQSFKFLGILFAISVVTYSLLIVHLHDTFSVEDLIVKFLDLITITVPHGIVISMTAGIYYALDKMQKQDIFCIESSKVIDGGDVDLVCFDKTGTLTESFMDFLELLPMKLGMFINTIQAN